MLVNGSIGINCICIGIALFAAGVSYRAVISVSEANQAVYQNDEQHFGSYSGEYPVTAIGWLAVATLKRNRRGRQSQNQVHRYRVASR